MAKLYTPPTEIEEEDYIKHMVFLAGSIEMDKAENWQTRLIERLIKIDNLTILNPRRAHWDSSWEQSINNPIFVEQVNWELDGIESADTIIFYFDPNTISPVTLLEWGMVSKMAQDKNLILCCPNGFWRKGNVDVVAERIKRTILDDNYLNPSDQDLMKLNKRFLAVDSINELINVADQFLRDKTLKR